MKKKKEIDVGSIINVDGIGKCRVKAFTVNEDKTDGVELSVLSTDKKEMNELDYRQSIINAINLLAMVCEREEECSNCPLYSAEGGKCMFAYYDPISRAETRDTDAVWRAVE